MNPVIVLLAFLLLIIILLSLNSCKFNCSNKGEEDYTNLGYSNHENGYKDVCEFSWACAYNSGQTCTLSGNRPGTCTLHGKCCPSFSIDESRMKDVGLPSELVGNMYQRMLMEDNYN